LKGDLSPVFEKALDVTPFHVMVGIEDEVEGGVHNRGDEASHLRAKDAGEEFGDGLDDLLDELHDRAEDIHKDLRDLLKELLEPAGAFDFLKAALFPGE
jgi:hypothetical protein